MTYADSRRQTGSVGRPRVLPPTNDLIRMFESGMTHQQIADQVFADTGTPVSRSTVSAALHRAGKTRGNPRYKTEIPWKVRSEHLTEYPVRMLRLLGRRRSGKPIPPGDETRLDNWLELLDRENAVVAYDPNNPVQGFHYVDRRDGDGANGVPIRVRPISGTAM